MFLAKADASGNVSGVSKRLAASANVSIEEYDKAMTILTAPDPESKSPDHEGRRLLPIPGGWHLVNHAKYRSNRDPEKRREQNREAKRRQRQRQKEAAKSAPRQPKSAQAEAEAEAEADKRILSLKQWGDAFEVFWAIYPRKKSKGDARKAWEKLERTDELRKTIFSKIHLLVKVGQWKKDDPKYIPYPATWLNREGWNDEVEDGHGRGEKPPGEQAGRDGPPANRDYGQKESAYGTTINVDE
jgi:hypothetical protein